MKWTVLYSALGLPAQGRVCIAPLGAGPGPRRSPPVLFIAAASLTANPETLPEKALRHLGRTQVSSKDDDHDNRKATRPTIGRTEVQAPPRQGRAAGGES